MAERTGPQPSRRERPDVADVADVVAMDVRMARLDGIEATWAVLRCVPGPPKILVVTTFGQDDYVYEALRAGADGFASNAPPLPRWSTKCGRRPGARGRG